MVRSAATVPRRGVRKKEKNLRGKRLSGVLEITGVH